MSVVGNSKDAPGHWRGLRQVASKPIHAEEPDGIWDRVVAGVLLVRGCDGENDVRAGPQLQIADDPGDHRRFTGKEALEIGGLKPGIYEVAPWKENILRYLVHFPSPFHPSLLRTIL